MKRLFCFFSLLLSANLTFAGGIVTNTNQSVGWVRMLARDASTDIDATYYNPAGLTKLSDGLHLYVSNQSLFQKRKLTNSLFPNQEWEGKVDAPFYPNLYVAYKTGKFAFSVGFTPIGGGGTAKFDKGIPMIELLIAGRLVPTYQPVATALGTTITGYNYNASFEGSSIYYGMQGGISYAITDMISAYAGARYVMIKNSYKGSITNISLSTAQTGITITNEFLSGIPTLAPYAVGLADYNIDVEQTGNGIAPILGLNLAFMEDKLNIGIKYEFQANIEVENKTKEDDIEMYPDGEKTNADIPAILTIGARYKFSDKFSSQIGFHTYFDKSAGWSTIENSNPEIKTVDDNFLEFAIGFEYSISEKLLLSCGYMAGITGVNDYFYSDLSMSLNSNNFGIGGVYKINDKISFEFGAFNGWYKEETIQTGSYSQTYDKSNYCISLGLDFNFGGGE